YKAEANRTLDVKSNRFEALKDEIDMDTRMKRVNRLANLTNEVLVRPGIRKGKIVWDIITPDICTVIQDENDPTEITAACWRRTLANTMGSSLIEYEYMDDLGYWGILDNNFRPMQEGWFYTPNDTPYRDADGRPVMMLVPIHRQSPECDFWDGDSGRDLYNAAVMLGIKMTLCDYYFKNASFKQIYTIGSNVELADKQRLDPLTMIKVFVDPQTQGEVGVLDLQNRIDLLLGALTYQVNSVINNYGISADMWTMSIAEMSGRALKIKNRALLEQRQEQLPVYRKAEAELFRRTRILNNAHARFYRWEKIPDQAEFSVDFGEIEWPDDPIEEMDILTRKLKSGIISLARFYQHFNPDVKDEKLAEKAITENLNNLKALRDANPTLDEALDFVLKGDKQGGQFGAQDKAQDKGDGA
ncbi:MAG: hypothetical protein ACYDH3_00325, partial [Candidatus Aminicenantales bacterium]